LHYGAMTLILSLVTGFFLVLSHITGKDLRLAALVRPVFLCFFWMSASATLGTLLQTVFPSTDTLLFDEINGLLIFLCGIAVGGCLLSRSHFQEEVKVLMGLLCLFTITFAILAFTDAAQSMRHPPLIGPCCVWYLFWTAAMRPYQALRAQLARRFSLSPGPLPDTRSFLLARASAASVCLLYLAIHREVSVLIPSIGWFGAALVVALLLDAIVCWALTTLRTRATYTIFSPAIWTVSQ
jgi:hypothetical protein